MNPQITHYKNQIFSKNPTIPAIMDEYSCLALINEIYEKNFEKISEAKTENLKNFYYFGIEDDKKQFNIKTVREAISLSALAPYEGKNIFIFDEFDTAGESAQNATLKLIEDCPKYIVIILVTKNHKKLLETIFSRAILIIDNSHLEKIHNEITDLIDTFLSGKKVEFLSHLYSANYDRDEAIFILQSVFKKLNSQQQKICKKYIFDLASTNENPRNILEAFFLSDCF